MNPVCDNPRKTSLPELRFLGSEYKEPCLLVKGISRIIWASWYILIPFPHQASMASIYHVLRKRTTWPSGVTSYEPRERERERRIDVDVVPSNTRVRSTVVYTEDITLKKSKNVSLLCKIAWIRHLGEIAPLYTPRVINFSTNVWLVKARIEGNNNKGQSITLLTLCLCPWRLSLCFVKFIFKKWKEIIMHCLHGTV